MPLPRTRRRAGPLVGDWSNIPREVSCQLEYASDPMNHYQNYFPAIGAAEHTDAIHSGVQPGAEFTGDYMGNMGNNVVFQHISDTTYQQIVFVTFDGPSAGYLMGGWLAPPPSTGQFVSKFDPASGAQIWKTQVQNLATSGQWLAAGSMAIHENGFLYVAAGPTVTKIDRDTGAIVAQQQQPILAGGAENANFDGMHFAPDDKGTILLKTQNRPEGCPTQGNGAMGSCQAEYGPQPVTTVVAVDPDTLDNIDAIALPQQVTARPIVTTHNLNIYIYSASESTLMPNISA